MSKPFLSILVFLSYIFAYFWDETDLDKILFFSGKPLLNLAIAVFLLIGVIWLVTRSIKFYLSDDDPKWWFDKGDVKAIIVVSLLYFVGIMLQMIILGNGSEASYYTVFMLDVILILGYFYPYSLIANDRKFSLKQSIIKIGLYRYLLIGLYALGVYLGFQSVQAQNDFAADILHIAQILVNYTLFMTMIVVYKLKHNYSMVD